VSLRKRGGFEKTKSESEKDEKREMAVNRRTREEGGHEEDWPLMLLKKAQEGTGFISG
jgi:hypothetical protein